MVPRDVAEGCASELAGGWSWCAGAGLDPCKMSSSRWGFATVLPNKRFPGTAGRMQSRWNEHLCDFAIVPWRLPRNDTEKASRDNCSGPPALKLSANSRCCSHG